MSASPNRSPTPIPPSLAHNHPSFRRSSSKTALRCRPRLHIRQFRPHRHRPLRGQGFQAKRRRHYVPTTNYRDPAKPAFATLTLKGGGDAASAARAVLETVNSTMPGTCRWSRRFWRPWSPPARASWKPPSAPRSSASTSIGTTRSRSRDKRSTKEAGPHPALSDPAVRRALSLAIDPRHHR